MGGFLGGMGGGSKSTSTSSSGYSALTPGLQSIFDKLAVGIGKYTDPANKGVIDAFSPLAQTGDESRAFDLMRQGFTPNAQSLQSDISMLMNPLDQFVIDDINREAQGQNSVLNQSLNAAGQLGSNRGLLGANDIEQTRLGTIGKLRQDQYNKAIDQVFNNLVPGRAADAQRLLGIGNFQRGLDQQTSLAPVSALLTGTGMLSPYVSGNGMSTQTQSGSGGLGGFLGGLGNLASGIGTAGSAFGLGGFGSSLASSAPGMAATAFMGSDRRLKEKIIPVGEQNGFTVYEFNYTGKPQRYRGVMAQEVAESRPDAVALVDGYLAVNYDAIGVKMEMING